MDGVEAGPERDMWEVVHQEVSRLFLIRALCCVRFPSIFSMCRTDGIEQY